MRLEAKDFFNLIVDHYDFDDYVHVLVNSEIHGYNKDSLKSSELSDLSTTWITNLLTVTAPEIPYTIINSGNVCFAMKRSEYTNFFIEVKKNNIFSKESNNVTIRSKITRLNTKEALALTSLRVK